MIHVQSKQQKQKQNNINKLLTISEIHKTNFKFKTDQQGPLKKGGYDDGA